MNRANSALQKDNNTSKPLMHLAFELSDSKWKLGFSDGERQRYVTIEARGLPALENAIEKTRVKFCLPEDVRIVSCYEAGRDGFWFHRYLLDNGIENIVVDSSSIEVNRRARRVKSDKMDVRKLLVMLLRYHGGERGLWSVVNVPSIETEDERRPHRELKRLKKERTGHLNRIKSLLVLQGIKLAPRKKGFREQIERVCLYDGSPLPANIKGEIIREFERLELVEKHIKILEREQLQRLKNPVTLCDKKVKFLESLRGVGLISSTVLVKEFFGWRDFKKGKEVASAGGLTPTPYDSGASRREQGIGKDGNSWVRALMVELSWSWIRYQPHSKITIWFNERFATGGKRMRKIGIVAVARKLLIALWRFVEHGVIPDGSVFKPV